ncbi:zf-HC2 domain-containing protein [Amycolatopsis sp. K13G38]|uniref:Zf-HC2 domain-containing protein n=1 Tax=Amycolatopsis acididurans TaxID=2724524 RepID=A0ABX1JAZ4_9PSEU|nr:zf-HC2 domain-containing protein [Amycolatopsis acididurans]NKQ56858.1 zf-HC2 domain-containing protein [Amycolatopsis acididurans]
MGVTHTDVAAYVLGVLDEAERALFEAHLSDCPHCQLDLLEMYEIPEILAEVGKYWPDPPIPQPRALDGLLDEVAARRNRKRRIGWLVAAAALLLIVAGPVLALAFHSAGDPAQAAPPALASVQPPQSAPATTGSASLFAGGQASSAMQAQVIVQTTSWGSQVDLILSGMSGPRQCALVAVPWAGPDQTVTTWTVPGAAPAADAAHPLRISGGTALASADIARFEIRDETGAVLATIPR